MADLNTIQTFISAKNPTELQKKMLINNHAHGIQYSYQTPVYNGKEWFVWFFADMTTWKNPDSLDEKALSAITGMPDA